ncbi:major facilitator superfamily domain-containing protein [Tirmania nivea]|nr:major facilitator superfamily domain-containing protein [Tirmania nivea]
MLGEDEILAEEDATHRHGMLSQASIEEQPPVANESSPLLGKAINSSAVTENDILREWEHVSWRWRPSVYWLLIPFTLFTMAHGSIAVPKLNIIMELICRDYYVDQKLPLGDILRGALGGVDSQCQIPQVQALVSRFALYLQLIAGVLSAITAPILGGYSDRYGRRLVLIISASGLLASEVTSTLAAKYPHIFSVNLLLFGAILDGVTGSLMVGMAVAHSYAADCTTAEKRAVSFGYFQGSLFLGIAAGPALGGMLIKATGNVLSIFYAALAAHGFFMLYIMILLPESLTPARMRAAQEKHVHQQSLREQAAGSQPRSYAHAFKSWNPLQPLAILFPIGPGSSPRLRTNLVVLAVCGTLFFGAGMGGMTVCIMYAEMMFKWGNYESSIYLSFVNCARVAMLFVAMPLAVKAVSSRWKGREANAPPALSNAEGAKHTGASTLDILRIISLIRFAIVTEFIGYLGYAVVTTGRGFTLAGMMTALGGIGSPTIQSALTKHITRDKTGQLLGASALLHSLARILFPTIFNLIYAGTVGTFPQAVFVGLASVFSLSAGCSYFITPHLKLHEDKHGNVVDGEHVSSPPSTPSLEEAGLSASVSSD